MPHPDTHAQLSAHSQLLLVWGNSIKPANSMLTSTFEMLSRGSGGVLDADRIVVLVAPLFEPDPTQLSGLIDELRQEITQHAQHNGDPGTAGSADFTQAPSSSPPVVVCDNRIWASIFESASAEDAAGRVSSVLGLGS
jgi:hypothetical protein